MWSFIKRIWQSKWQNKATIVGGIIIILSGLGGAIYGIASSSGDEGLIKIGEKKLHWLKSDMAIDCTFVAGVKSNHLDMYDKARAEIHVKIGKFLFSPCVRWMLEGPPPEYIEGQVMLRVAEPSDANDPFKAHPGGTTQHKFDKRTGLILAAALTVDLTLKEELQYRVWLHELGHVLGLAHDRTDSSIMYPKVTDRAKSLSDKDIDLLKEVYGD